LAQSGRCELKLEVDVALVTARGIYSCRWTVPQSQQFHLPLNQPPIEPGSQGGILSGSAAVLHILHQKTLSESLEWLGRPRKGQPGVWSPETEIPSIVPLFCYQLDTRCRVGSGYPKAWVSAVSFLSASHFPPKPWVH
jgi:hypothetical protein